ncbi:L-aspartate/L-glutamate decarboxylase [Candidatus Methanobinarius endosymbioticus]|uniref:Probable L-tyrosine/L-aspartate decarboxylase n=1 Tax=Candidatus Methanobinarius endosymbioticus TaxID=2006182 RepID=A0A366MA22_9EURY|nr:L-aspartate/L-glutamate decarboxylase [Candidatus Methanobinarius endosymbioticus]
MDNEPIKKEEILEKLSEFKNQNLNYSDGKILGSMCTRSDPFSKEVFCDFLDSNLGDPGLFKGTQTLEEMVIDDIGSFLSLEKSFGNIVTGGTEANLMAIRSARNITRKEKGIGDINNENEYTIPEIIVPRSAHFSFKKAADLLNLKLIEADLDENYRVDIESVKNNISENTIAIVGIAGTTELGMIDPIKELSDLATEKNIYFHVDAAFGGFSIPFLNDFGYEIPPFDFALEGVCSITIDPHKMGLAPIPSGCIIFREKKYLDIMAVKSPYLTSKEQSTIVGTRLGAPVAATWAIMQYMGREGYAKNANECMINTEFLADALFKEDFELITEPDLNIVAFTHPEINTDDLADMLEKKGWRVSVSSYPKSVRIVLMQHIKYTHLIDFLTSIREIKSDLNIR